MLLAAIREVLAFISGARECVVCGKRCGALSLCGACKERVIKQMSFCPSQKRCAVCGKLLLSEKDVCMRCRGEDRTLYSVKRVLPLAPYRMWMRELLTTWKGEGEMALSPFFAKRIAMVVSALGDDIIVPVPPRKKKIYNKGYDQIEDLCRYLKKDFIVLRLLYRATNIEQKTLSGNERRATIKLGAYKAKSGKALKKALRKTKGNVPPRVCLIDDVMTTGSTIESCAVALLSLGIKEVDVVTLFCVD